MITRAERARWWVLAQKAAMAVMGTPGESASVDYSTVSRDTFPVLLDAIDAADALREAAMALVEEASYPCACAFNRLSYMRSRWEHNKSCPILEVVRAFGIDLARYDALVEPGP